jgi:dTDP-4-amino-4,6-dideoxygalactose transaminase
MQPQIPTYPTPTIPLAPVLSSFRVRSRQTGPIPSLLETASIVHVTSGRSAIALALEDSGIKAGDIVLAPSYHCESMISPIRWAGADPLFYRVNLDTSLDMESIAAVISPRVKAIIVTHYFGFLQDLAPIRALCDDHNITLIEDCAHAFFGVRNRRPVGYFGDYAIASTMKYFPVYDGGCLASRTRDLSQISLCKPDWKFQVKSALVPLERSSSYHRFPIVSKVFGFFLGIKTLLWGVIKKRLKTDAEQQMNPPASDGTQGLDPHWIHVECTRASQVVIHKSNFLEIAERRRENFSRLLSVFSDLPGARPLFKALPEGTVPLVFPLYVDEPHLHFDEMKRKGVPIWRFGEFLDPNVDSKLCASSVELSAHLFQFPCHQELREDELSWLIDQVQQSFRAK